MIETGYLGLLILAWLLVKPALIALKYFQQIPQPENALSFTFFVVMAAYYFMMTNVNMYSWGQNGYMLWILIGLSMACGRLSRTENAS